MAESDRHRPLRRAGSSSGSHGLRRHRPTSKGIPPALVAVIVVAVIGGAFGWWLGFGRTKAESKRPQEQTERIAERPKAIQHLEDPVATPANPEPQTANTAAPAPPVTGPVVDPIPPKEPIQDRPAIVVSAFSEHYAARHDDQIRQFRAAGNSQEDLDRLCELARDDLAAYERCLLRWMQFADENGGADLSVDAWSAASVAFGAWITRMGWKIIREEEAMAIWSSTLEYYRPTNWRER
jgi:hypothetical protein